MVRAAQVVQVSLERTAVTRPLREDGATSEDRQNRLGGDGGDGGDGGIVAINGGIVTATGGTGASGIGGGVAGASGVAVMLTGARCSNVFVIDEGSEGADAKVTFRGGVTESQNGIFTEGDPEVSANMEVTGEFNKAAYIKIAEKPGPTCTGGDITKEDGVWVVTPTGNATEVAITGLPAGDSVVVPPTVTKVTGAADDKIIVKSGTHDITDAFTITDGAIALDPEGEVNGVKVQPTIGELGENDGEPFVVGEGSAAVTVKAIPGLKYELRRAGALEAPAAESAGGTVWGVVGESVVAEDATVTLTDGNPPEGAAFYRVVVSVPGGESPSESGGSDDVKPTPTNGGGFEINTEVESDTLTIVSLSVDAANDRVLLKVGAETTANVDAVVANFFNVTVRKGAEVTVKVEQAESPIGPWTELQGISGKATIDRAGADIEVKLDGELPAQGFFRVKVTEVVE